MNPSLDTHHDRTGANTRTLMGHIKEYFDGIPTVTLALLLASVGLTLVDGFGFVFSSHYKRVMSHWLYLSAAKVLYNGEVFRMALYPLASPGMVLVINNLLLSVPYMTRLEHKEGSFRALWILLFIYGLLPGMAYVVLVAVLVSLHHSLQGSLVWTVSEGFSVFAVALSVASVLQEEEEHGQVQDHMLLGAIRVPGRAVPALILVFYFFLAPNTSILLHLCAALAGYLYATHRLPSVLLPIDESIRQQEEEGWLQKIAGTRRYVRADGSGPYLPIHSTAPLPPYAFSTAPSPSAPPSTTPSAVRAFPGEGNRLGDQ